MKTFCYWLPVVLILPTGLDAVRAAGPEEPITPEGVIRLFDGRDLSGWTTWLVDASDTDRDVTGGAYKAAIECQVMEGGFGGILLIHGRYADGRHVPVRASMHATKRDVDPDYAKYQFDPKADALTLRTGAIAWQDKDTAWKDVPGFRGKNDVESPLGQWTRVECVCRGDRVGVLVNGKRVNEAYNIFPAAGKILLQCEGSEIFFRKIELHPLGPNRAD